MKTVLITGGAGYIGSVLVSRILATTDWKVVVGDNLMHDGRAGLLHFLNHPDRFSFIREDIREMNYKVLDRCDYVVNLAALVGEALCKKSPQDSWSVNTKAAIWLAEQCNRHGVKHYIFSSTCSNYGVKKDLATEADQLNPVSIYAETKVEAEKFIFAMDSTATDVTIMRFATAFGLSLRNRFDLLLHEFIKDAWTQKVIRLFGGDFYRPLIHTDDIARAIITSLESEQEGNEVYNIGSTEFNYTKRQLAEMVAKRIPCEIIEHRDQADPRDYRVSFEKAKKNLGFLPAHSPSEAINQIATALEQGVLNSAMMQNSVNA